MRKMLCALLLATMLLFAFAGISQAGSIGFLGFTIGDSTKTCASQMHQLQEKGLIDSVQIIDHNQIGINLKLNNSPVALILTFKNDKLSSLLVAAYASPSLKSVLQQIREELPGLIKKFGEPTSINKNIDTDIANNHKFTNVVTWEYEDGEAIFVGIYHHDRIYRMFMIMQAATEYKTIT